MRILLVDDNADMRLLFTEYFVLCNHEMVTASTALEALELVAASDFDAIVLDIVLPDLDGYALACRIRRLLAYKARPRLVAISASHFDAKHPLAIEADFDAYLLKPAHMDIIEAALQRDHLKQTV
jgi:CheY-like chemotaxis protein